MSKYDKSLHVYVLPLMVFVSVLLLMLWSSAGALIPTHAQDASTPVAEAPAIISASECGTPLSTLWLTASDACVGKPFGFVCNGNLAPLVEPAGPVSNSLMSIGSLVETGVVESLHTGALSPYGEGGGVVWLRVSEPDTFVQYSALLVGDVQLHNVTPPDFPAWQALTVKTSDAQTRCENAPHSSMIVQNLPGTPGRVVVNGISLDLNGTAVIQTNDTVTRYMVLSGTLGIVVFGQRVDMLPGQEIAVPFTLDNLAQPAGLPSAPSIFDDERVENLPVLLLDRPVQVPQGGFARTDGAVNLRTAPTLDEAVIVQVPAGTSMTVLGRNPEGDWYHVQLTDGQTGWMFAELLSGEVGEIDNVYVATPQPQQRLGELGQLAKVIAPNGVSLRSAPDISFSTISTLGFGTEVNLMARSPYSPWVKVDVSSQIGWVPLITMETRAIIDALPIDYDVPPPPEPTAIPGSFGGAFPNPNCYPNC